MTKNNRFILALWSVFILGAASARADIPVAKWEECRFYEKPVYCNIDKTKGIDECVPYTNNRDYRFVASSRHIWPASADKYEREYCGTDRRTTVENRLALIGAGVIIISVGSYLGLRRLRNRKNLKK
jgi:hypothetical protein